MSPRYLPEVTVDCRVCGAPITIHNRFEPGKGVVSEPGACPTCGAIIKNRPPIDVGMAKSLVLLASGARAEKKEYGTVERFFDRYTLGEADVEALMALADGLEKSPAAAKRLRDGVEAARAAYRAERERALRTMAERKR